MLSSGVIVLVASVAAFGDWGLTATNTQPLQHHTFVLPGYPTAKQVYVAGAFNDWNPRSVPMTKTATGWSATVALQPREHAYKFIVDGTWITDPTHSLTADDGAGHTNSLLIIPSLQGSTEFTLKGYPHAKKVALAGTFNGWNNEVHFFARQPRGKESLKESLWVCRLNIRPGMYEYRYVVDNTWMQDSANTLAVENEFGGKNSVLVVPSTEGTVEFTLAGYPRAQAVALAGTFNGWSTRRHLFFRQGNLWKCRLHLPSGRYQYKFVVDGRWVLDPNNTMVVENEFGTGNNVLVVKAAK